jgi:S-adenosylmethionine synthetase
MNYKNFTSESVCAGHPDKVCDQISDAVLDEAYKQDKYSRVAVENLATKGRFIMAGEVTSKAKLDFRKIAKKVIKKLGYTDPNLGFDYKTTPIDVYIHKQSPDISQSVDEGGAGDQGCIKKGSLVKTDKGYMFIEDIKRGMRVITPYGYKKVLGSQKTGVKEIIELKFKSGRVLQCTPDHQLLCFQKNGELYWKQAAKLNKSDFICLLKPSSFKNSYCSSKVSQKSFFTKYNHKIYGPEKVVLDEDLGYILGLIMGDGSINSKKWIIISFGKNKALALTVKKILDKKFPNQWRLIENKDNIDLKIDSVLARKHLENLGVLYQTGPYKTTPKTILTSPISVIKSYLRGLFDSGGPITGSQKENIRIRLSSPSYKLLQESQLLLAELEIKTTILLNASKKRPVNRQPQNSFKYDNYVLSVKGSRSCQNFAKKIGFKQPKQVLRMKKYFSQVKNKPENSPGIYLLPHPKKDELIPEKLLGKTYPFTIGVLTKKIKRPKAEVYDLEIKEKNMFSANGIYVHNSMFGYACKETPQLMPAPIIIAHKLAKRLDEVREKKIVSYLRPDGKSEITLEYDKGKPIKVNHVVLAAAHQKGVENGQLKKDLFKHVVKPVLAKFKLKTKINKLIVNGGWTWHIGGPASDTGETGRKIIVDTYGGMGRHGGGCFSGKDLTKVDRSGAYACRFLAKNILAAGLADRVEVKVAYVIGQPNPLERGIETFGTEKKSIKEIEKFAFKLLDLSVPNILKKLNLRQPIYQKTAAYGHFGRDSFPWEKIVV